MLLSIKDMTFTYIDKTFFNQIKKKQHKSDIGSDSTELMNLRPYALFAYIWGFNNNNDLLFYLEMIYKEKWDQLIRNGVNDPKSWAYCGEEIISDLNEERFGVKPTDLTLVCLFNE